jgi:hypothetical protein
MAPKAKKAAKKRTSERRGRPKGKASRDWTRIKRKWFESTLTLDGFIRYHKLARSSARRYLSVKEKNEVLNTKTEAAESFRQKIAAITGKEEGRLYVSALKHTLAASQEILLDSADAFKASGEELSKEKAARLVLAASETLIRSAQELQGIPDEDELDGWPLSRAFVPFKHQRDFVLDTPSGVRLEEHLAADGSEDPFLFAFIGGRGAGKTHVGAQKYGQVLWLNRGHDGLVLAPTYPMLRDTAKAAFLKACSDKGLSFTHLKTENAIILFGDTKVYFRSMDDPDKVRGLNVASAWLEEPGQLSNREGYDIANGCIRGKSLPEPCILVTTTPAGLGWLYDLIVTEAEANRVRLYRARTADNPTLGDFEQRLRTSYDPLFARQELDAEFLSIFGGMAYWNYTAADNVFAPRDLSIRLQAAAQDVDANGIHNGYPVDLMCDFNVSPMCWNIGQDLGQNGEIFSYIHDEIHLDTAGTDVTVQEFIERWGDHKAVRSAGVRLYGDATGAHKGTSASRSDYEIIEQALKKAGIAVDVNIGRSNPRQRDRVLSVNGRLLNALGSRRLFISDRCKWTKIDFERTSFIPGTQQLDKSETTGSSGGAKRKRKPTLTHHTDAVGYKVFAQWPIRGMEVTQVRAV